MTELSAETQSTAKAPAVKLLSGTNPNDVPATVSVNVPRPVLVSAIYVYQHTASSAVVGAPFPPAVDVADHDIAVLNETPFGKEQFAALAGGIVSMNSGLVVPTVTEPCAVL